jgi:hypothetical protein
MKKDGPAYGINPSEAKSKLVVDAQAVDRARELTRHTQLKVVSSARNLGGVIGATPDIDSYAREKVVELTEKVRALASIAPDDPHAAFAVFNGACKSTYIYQQRVVPCSDPEAIYGPLEVAIRSELIPRLTGWTNVSPLEREMLELPIREGGMAIDNPIKTALPNYKASSEATAVMQTMIICGLPMEVEDFDRHHREFGQVTSKAKSDRREYYEKRSDALGGEPGQRRGKKQAKPPDPGQAVTRDTTEAERPEPLGPVLRTATTATGSSSTSAGSPNPTTPVTRHHSPQDEGEPSTEPETIKQATTS